LCWFSARLCFFRRRRSLGRGGDVSLLHVLNLIQSPLSLRTLSFSTTVHLQHVWIPSQGDCNTSQEEYKA
jgi:hypothetical protein